MDWKDSIYYGDEAGIAGRLDTNEGFRYPMPWSREFQKEAAFFVLSKTCQIKSIYIFNAIRKKDWDCYE